MRIFYLLFTILLILPACSKKVQEKIGIVSSGPNEYLVKRNKTLEMPPHYDLPNSPNVIIIEKKNSQNHGKFDAGEKALLSEIEK